MIETYKNDAGWNFENSYMILPETFYSSISPTPVKEPRIVKLNNDLACFLGLNVKELQSNEGTDVLAGNQLPIGSKPIAQAYAGHQFGYFTMLGDGRALLIGEQITPKGERYDIQLKGSGKTPYSRGGDGRAALGPMLREYIISEAMVRHRRYCHRYCHCFGCRRKHHKHGYGRCNSDSFYCNLHCYRR